MKQKKHKIHKQQTSLGRIKTLYYDLVAEKPNGETDVTWNFAMTIPFNDLKYKPLENKSNQKLAQFLRKTCSKPTVGTEADFQFYNNRIAAVKTSFENQFNYILSCCKDIDQTVNIWSSEAKSAVIDTVDYREYMKNDDLTNQAFSVLQDNPDIAMLWSNSENFDIIISDAVFYRVHRVMYDYLNIGVRYVVCEYNRFHLSDKEVLTVPVSMVCIQYDPSRISPGIDETICDLKTDKHIKLNEKAYAQLTRFPDKPDSLDYHVVEICNLGQMGFLNIASHMMLHHEHLPKTTYRLFKDMIPCLYYDMYGMYPSQQMGIQTELAEAHIETINAVVASAILIMNSYLKAKKLSKPVASAITYGTDIILQNRFQRKTRMLGNNIKIMSDTRPEPPDHEKLIKYHTPEWERKAHLRHLKNGRVVEIPAGKCYRKCVDMSNVTSLMPQQAVDYIVNPADNERT